MSSTSFTTASVRPTEAPSGSRSAANKAPWSSSGRKLCGVLLNSQRRSGERAGHDQYADDRGAREPANHGHVAVADAVDPAQHIAHEAAAALPMLEQHPAQRRAQGQRVERRDQHGDRDRHRELTKEEPADAGDECDRDEHREEHEGDGEDRAGNLRHGFLAGVPHRHLRVLLDHALDVLHHDDGVVDDNADGEHQREQRHGIGRIADEQHHREGADDRDRHRKQRDQRGAPFAQEQEHHHGNENDGRHQRANDLLDGRADKDRGVPEHGLSEVARKARREPAHGVANAAGDLDRIGAWGLVDADRGCRGAVEPAVAILRFGAHLHARHVLDADDGAVGIGAQHDGGEFLRTRQPALGLDVDLDLLLAPGRRRADAAERGLDILARHRRDDVVRRHVELGEAIGVEPDAQRIVERTEQGCLADAFDPRQRIDDVDGRVVAEVDGIVGVVGGVDVDHLQQRGGLLADGEASARHFRRQLRRGEAYAVLHVDGVDVGIGAERKRHREVVAAVGAAGGLVIDRVVDAVDLLLDRLRDRGLHHFGVGARIVGLHRDLRGHDVGELRDRDGGNGDRAGKRNDDGDDDGKARPVDEDVGKHRGLDGSMLRKRVHLQEEVDRACAIPGRGADDS